MRIGLMKNKEESRFQLFQPAKSTASSCWVWFCVLFPKSFSHRKGLMQSVCVVISGFERKLGYVLVRRRGPGAAMAALPCVLRSESFGFVSPNPALSLRRIRASKSVSLVQCSLHSRDPDSLPCQASTSSSQSDTIPGCAGQLGRTSWVGLGLGAVAGVMTAFPHHAAAAEMASSLDAWSALAASEPKNALSLPTWVIHVASVAEWLVESVLGSREVQSAFRETELTNALSLPTWFIHVASVAEWVTAMALVWRYGDTPGNSTWKGLSWGMVPLLGGAMCACTWHFFYNAQSLEILVVFQAALTVIGNFTMWIAAFRIYQSSQKQSKSS